MILPLTMMTTLDALPFLGPVHRTIVIVDIEGSTRRNNPAKGEMRRILYILLKRALLISGISQRHVEPTDRGDGALLLIRPDDEIPKTVVLGRLIPVLVTLLREHNASLDPSDWLRLRVVVHAGEVHFDGNGCYGNDVDVACRLLDAAAFKKALKEAVELTAGPGRLGRALQGDNRAGLPRLGPEPAADLGPCRHPPTARPGHRARRRGS